MCVCVCVCEIDKLSYIKIFINVLKLITKIFTHIDFCKVNMNYMWNDIYTCYVEWYMPTLLSSSKDTSSWVLWILIHIYL